MRISRQRVAVEQASVLSSDSDLGKGCRLNEREVVGFEERVARGDRSI